MQGNAAQSDAGAARFALNRFLLVFKNGEVERDFSAHSYAHSLFFIRLYLVAAVVLYSSFGILDAIIGKEYHDDLWRIRYGFAVPVMLVVLALSYTRGFYAYVQPALATAMAAASSWVPPPSNPTDHTGLPSASYLRVWKSAPVSAP